MQFLNSKCHVRQNLTYPFLLAQKNNAGAKISRTYHKKQRFWHNGTWILPGIVPKICSFWILNVILSKIWPHHFNGLQKTWLEPKFEVSNSKNTNFGIMVPGFYLGLYLKYAVFEFLTSSWVKSDPPIFTGSQNHGCSQNFMHLSQETQILE